MKRWEVLSTHSGVRLQNFLKEKLGESVSAKQIKHAIDSGKCRLNGKPERFSSRLVGSGDKIELDLSHPSEKSQKKTHLLGEFQRVLYSDDDVVAYNKPSGVSSDSKEVLDALSKHFGSLILLHRLDKETTGILLFARNEMIARAIETLFKQRLVKKTYLAIVNGIPSKSFGTIENFLGKLHVYQGQTIWGAVPREKGLLAKTRWKMQKSGKRASLLICYPETGRTHQIRVHLSSLGHPILGDHQYGRLFTCDYRPQRVLLHASEIIFEHPRTKQVLHIRCSIPNDFIEASKCLWGNDE